MKRTTKGDCHYCGEPATTMDHIIPISKGGKSIDKNLVPACSRCNSNKSNNSYEDFMHFLAFVKEGYGSLKSMSRNNRKIAKLRFLKKTGIRIGDPQRP